MQQKVLQDPGLHFDTIDSFISYIYYLTSNKNSLGGTPVDYDSEELLSFHKEKSVLKIDKYINCCIPSPELEFVLESTGIQDYGCYIDPEYNFKHSICTNEEVLSEIFTPIISGDHFNPYIRFKSCISGSSRSCSNLMDLAGLEIKDIDSDYMVHDNIFLDLVCTFPGVVDYYLMNPRFRSRLLLRMNKCRKEFFHRLPEVFMVPGPNTLGMSSSLHVWGSEVPLLPHSHIHNIIPYFSYNKKVVRDPNFFNDLNVFDLDLPNIEDYLQEIFIDFDITPRNSNKQFSSGPGEHLSKGKTRIVTSDTKIVKRYVVDRDKYNKLRLHISKLLRSDLGFEQCPWNSHNSPVDIDKLKELWSDIVYNEFQDIMDNWILLDIHLSWIPWYKKAKLRSALQYKCRPPVLDLDLFFKKCPGVVLDYKHLDIDKVLDYIQYQLVIAVKCSDIDKINRYESLLKKAESIFTNFSEEDLYSWLQFLSTWVTNTRVYGFWKNLKHYLLDPEHELLIVEEVCPICNGFITDTSIKVRSCVVDYVLVQSQNKYLVYDLGDPGG